MSRLRLRPIGDVADDQRRACRTRLGLDATEQRSVVRIGYTADHERQRCVANRYPTRCVPEALGDFLDALAHRPADPVGVRQCARHGGNGDVRFARHVLERHRPAARPGTRTLHRVPSLMRTC